MKRQKFWSTRLKPLESPGGVDIWIRYFSNRGRHGLGIMAKNSRKRGYPLDLGPYRGRGQKSVTPLHSLELQLVAVYIDSANMGGASYQREASYRTSLPVKNWIDNMFHWTASATAQTPMLPHGEYSCSIGVLPSRYCCSYPCVNLCKKKKRTSSWALRHQRLSRGNPSIRMAASTGPSTDTTWAALRAVWLVIVPEPWPLSLCTASWVMA